MNWDGWLTALLVMLALAGCAPVVAMPGQAPNAPYQDRTKATHHRFRCFYDHRRVIGTDESFLCTMDVANFADDLPTTHG
jgi:hypothetical protein